MSEQMNFQITAQNNASRAIKDVSRDLGGLKGASQRAGMGLKVAFVAAGIAIGAATKFITDATKAAMEEEKINKRLIGVLKSRKLATAESTIAIEKQVAAGKKLAFSGDEIKSSLAAIIPFSKSTAEAIAIQNAAMEIAAAQNISLSKASTIVSRAYIGQGKSLAKLGIQTTKTEKVTTRVLVANKKWGASYKNVTKEVKTVMTGQEVLNSIMERYGGTAAKSAEGVEKQFKMFGDTVKDLKQEFGAAFLPIALKIAQTLNKDILPQLKPIVTGVADFITKNIPKFLAAVDPIIAKIAGPGGLVEGFLKMARAVWGENGEGPLGRAVAGLGGLLGTVLDTVNKVITAVTGNTVTPTVLTDTFNQFGNSNPAFTPTSNATPSKNISLGGIPLIGGALDSAGVGINRQGAQTAAVAAVGGAALAKLIFGKIPGLGMLASLGLGGYMAGTADPGTSAMDTLGLFAGGAGTLQALSFFGAMRGGGGGGKGMPTMPSAGGGKPGILGRLGGALIPSFLRTKGGGAAAGVAGAAMGMGGVGAMTMSANTVYLNAASVVGGGMPGVGVPGMGMGAMQGPPVPAGMTKPAGRFARISQGFSNWKGAVTGSSQFGKLARFGGAVSSIGSMVAQKTGISTLASGIKGIGASAIGGVRSAGSTVMGGITNVGGRIASSGVGQAAIGGARAVGTGVGAVGKGIGIAGKGLGAVGRVASTGFKALGAGVPLVGGILAGANALAEGNGVGQAIGKGVGSAAGTAIGAGLLSWIPVAGPLLGGMIGGIIGEKIGGAIGEAVDGIGTTTGPTGTQQYTYDQYEAGKYKDGKYVGNAVAQYYSNSALNGGQAPQVTIVLNDKPLDDMITKVVTRNTPTGGGPRVNL
jgi:hypothetical protein